MKKNMRKKAIDAFNQAVKFRGVGFDQKTYLKAVDRLLTDKLVPIQNHWGVSVFPYTDIKTVEDLAKWFVTAELDCIISRWKPGQDFDLCVVEVLKPYKNMLSNWSEDFKN